jgi:glycosyltransferase involved in cell wall biosynthesis
MGKHFKVSVIVPVYNVEQYLRKCMDSLVNQTLRDIEIICINDCSPDNSLAVLKEYAEKDNRVKIIDLEKNCGVGAARNAGMKVARGEYFGFCDPDDYVDLNYYGKLHDKAKETGAEMVKASLKKKEADWVKEYSFFARITKNKYYDLLYHWSYIYEANFLKKYQINYLEGIKLSEDVYFLAKSLFYSTKVEAVADVFYHYIVRKHGAATSHIGEVIVNSYGTRIFFDFMNKMAKNKSEYEDFFNAVFSSLIFITFVKVVPEYKKAFADVLVDIYKNRQYSVTFNKMPKFLKESDFEDSDILFEKLNNNLILLKYPEIKIDNLRNRKLYIWGAGANGVDALIQCDNKGWKVEAFLDSNSLVKEYQGYGILHPQHLLNSKSKDFFIVISSRDYAGEIVEICERAGLREGVDFWKPC